MLMSGTRRLLKPFALGTFFLCGIIIFYKINNQIKPFRSSLTTRESRKRVGLQEDIIDLDSLNSTRRIVYTYFDDSCKLHTVDDNEMLSLWLRNWYSRGYLPKVLSRANAINHPKFEEAVCKGEAELDGEMDKSRWYALQGVGGGTIIDYKVLGLDNYEMPMIKSREVKVHKRLGPLFAHIGAEAVDDALQFFANGDWRKNTSYEARPLPSELDDYIKNIKPEAKVGRFYETNFENAKAMEHNFTSLSQWANAAALVNRFSQSRIFFLVPSTISHLAALDVDATNILECPSRSTYMHFTSIFLKYYEGYCHFAGVSDLAPRAHQCRIKVTSKWPSKLEKDDIAYLLIQKGHLSGFDKETLESISNSLDQLIPLYVDQTAESKLILEYTLGAIPESSFLTMSIPSKPEESSNRALAEQLLKKYENIKREVKAINNQGLN